MEVKKLLSIVELFDTDETIALTQRMIQIPSIDPPGNEADMSEFQFVFSGDACIKTCIYFAVMYYHQYLWE